MFVFYGKGYNQTYDTTLNMDLDITQKLDFVTPGLSVSVKGAYDNKFKLEKSTYGRRHRSADCVLQIIL